MITTRLKNAWIVCPKPHPSPRLRLFCFPCAGGMVSAYTRWATLLPADVELCIIHLPGRGRRLAEKPFVQVTQLIPVLAQALDDILNIPFVFLGHSMGAVLGFEMARYLRQHKHSGPSHLFCCSCPAPQMPIATPYIHTLPEATFIAELNRRYAAIPVEIQQDRDILQLFLPSLRADFKMLETYVYTAEMPLSCPISVYVGEQDNAVSSLDLLGWREQTSHNFNLKTFTGDHFFLHNHGQLFLPTLTETLIGLQ